MIDYHYFFLIGSVLVAAVSQVLLKKGLAPADRRAFRDRLGDPAELAACTADVRRSYDYAKWLQLTSKVEHSHSQNYAAYSH